MSRETSVPNFAYGASNQPLLDTIAAALEGLRYGTLEIIVHDGCVVQIDRKEKLRFETGAASKPFRTVKN